MKYICSIFCTLLSFSLGGCLTKYLTCHPLKMSIYLLSTCVLSFILVTLIYVCYKKRFMFSITLLISIILFISGYIITFQYFMDTTENRVFPVITRAKGDFGLGHTAVVVLAHGESETYDASAWIKQMRELDEQKIAFIPYPFRPFFFNSLREKYLMAGKSGHNFECLQIMKQIEAEYRKKGDTDTKFYISYLENEPRPDNAVVQALNEGASKIILCNIFVTISNHTKEAIDMVEPIKLQNYGVKIKYTKPLFDSKTLQNLYVNKVNSCIAPCEKGKVGIILVGHGQPPEWDKEFFTETQQETSFRTDILHQLELNGYHPHNLKLAWMEFREPRPKNAVKQLVDNGVTEIYYFSTIIGSESIHVKYDVPELMHEIDVPKTVKLQQLTAFDDKSGIVKALIERIEEQK